VLFLEGSTGLGGSGSFLFYMLQHLDRRFEPYLSTYITANTHHLNVLAQSGVPYLPLSSRRIAYAPWAAEFVTKCKNPLVRKAALAFSWLYYLLFVQGSLIWRLVRLLRKEQIAVLVLNNDVHYHTVGVIGAKLARVPVMVRKSGGINEGRLVKKLLTQWVDVFIPISKATLEDQLKNPSTRRAVLIPEAVDLKRFRPEVNVAHLRRNVGLPTDRVIIASASRLVEGKGQQEIIQAAAKVVAKFPDVLFCIAGAEDPADVQEHMLERLQGLAGKLGVAENVVFLGWRDDIEDILSCIDIFVHCPTTFIEGLCITNLEAMACGKPTVISENGGMPDAVVDGVTGFIVPPADVGALADALLKLLDDPQKARAMGRKGRDHIAEAYEVRVNRAYEELFDEYGGNGRIATVARKEASAMHS
jgi:glycosyltransferase involved in cell wall biosynthesis